MFAFFCVSEAGRCLKSQGSEDKMTGRASTFYLGGVRQSLFIYTFFFFPFLLDAPHGMQDVSSLTRDGTPAPCSGNTVLTTGLPGESHPTILIDVAGTQLPGLWRAARKGLHAEAGTQQALRNRYQNSVFIPRCTRDDVGDVAETDCAVVSGAAGESRAPPLPVLVLKVTAAQSRPTLYYPMDVAHWAPLSTGFSRQEYWSQLLFSSPGDVCDPGIEPGSPALQVDSLPSEPPGKSRELTGGGKVKTRAET